MKKQILEAFQKFGIVISTNNEKPDVNDYLSFYSKDSVENRRFYNIGAGNFKHPCWTNIDGESEWYTGINGSEQIGISCDLFDHKPFPIESNTAEIFYTSHTIEHLDDSTVAFLFKEVYRDLKKGGVFRIVTPDADMAYSAWKRGDRKYFYWSEWDSVNIDYEKQCINMPLRQASLSQIYIEDFAADASEIATVGGPKRISDEELKKLFDELPYEEVLNYCTSLCSIENQKKYPFRHMNWFNETKLNRMLIEAGFNNVKKSAYLQSDAHVLRNPNYFDQTLPKISIYMEATK